MSKQVLLVLDALVHRDKHGEPVFGGMLNPVVAGMPGR